MLQEQHQSEYTSSLKISCPSTPSVFFKEYFGILDTLAHYIGYMVQRLYLLSIVHVKASEETDIKGEKEDRQSFRTADRRNDGIICCLAV